MSLPEVTAVRERIENITENWSTLKMQAASQGVQFPTDRITPQMAEIVFKAVYLFGLRIGEICGYRFPSDKAQPTGMLLWAKEASWQIPDLDDDETIILLKRIMARNYGKSLSDEEVIAIKEPAFVLSIITEKREGFNRHAALPLNPDYEPWTKEVMQYILERQTKGPLPHLKELTEKLNGHNGQFVNLIQIMQTPEGQKICEDYPPIFPLTRQDAYQIAVQVFNGFSYPIVKYNKLKLDAEGQPVQEMKNGKLTNVYESIADHQKKYSDHANRHLRSTELKSKFRIKGDALNKFMGWASPRNAESSAMQERYVLEPWQEAGYFPKLLRVRA